jgi:hypothetical protein
MKPGARESASESVSDFLATTHTGGQVSSRDLLARAPVVLFFYPRAHSPGWIEACHFRDGQAEFEALGARCVGVSRDPVDVQASFAERHGLSASRSCRTPTVRSLDCSGRNAPDACGTAGRPSLWAPTAIAHLVVSHTVERGAFRERRGCAGPTFDRARQDNVYSRAADRRFHGSRTHERLGRQ